MRIEIVGNIATGKTTLAHLLGNSINGQYENFKENPFWESFYQSPEVYSFETEITFTLQHYHQIKKNVSPNHSVVFDFSLILDCSYADVTLKGNRHRIYLDVLRELQDEIGSPDILLYLRCPENELLKRIASRGRESEQTINLDYLQALTDSIDHNIKSLPNNIKVIEIDSMMLDFAHDEESKLKVTQSILKSCDP